MLEKKELRKLYDQGIAIGLRADELEILSREQCLALEPNLNPKVVAGLLCTSSHSVDPVILTDKLVASALLNEARLFLGNRVAGITKVGEEFCVETMNHQGVASTQNTEQSCNVVARLDSESEGESDIVSYRFCGVQRCSLGNRSRAQAAA